jgi:LysR family transcriptional regulator, regulator of abg operon
MNLDDIHLAIVIAREGSLTAASARLGITPPTLSKAVARLERATKVQLFERLARGMRPTELGQAFLDRARSIDLAAGDLHAALRDLRQARAGVLRCGFGQGVPDRWVLPMATALAGDGVRLDLTGGMTDLLMRSIGLGELEFAVLGLAAAPPEGYAWQPLLDDPMQPLAPNGHALARGRRAASWSQLAQARWIVPASGTSSHAEFERNFAAQGLATPAPLVASRSSQRELPLALALDALVLVPRSLLKEPGVQAQFARVAPPGGWQSERRLGIVSRAGGYLSPTAQRAMALLQQAVAAQP